MDENKNANVGILRKLFEAIVGIFIGLFKGIKFLMMIFPLCIVAFVFCLIFFKDQTISAYEFLRELFIRQGA